MNLSDARYISLRTYRKSGATVDTPVWFASEGSLHYVFSEAAAGKIKRLRNSSSAQVATCDMRGGSLGQWQACEAFIVEDPGEEAKAYRLLHAKYGFWMRLTDFFSRLSGRIDQRAVIRIET